MELSLKAADIKKFEESIIDTWTIRKFELVKYGLCLLIVL